MPLNIPDYEPDDGIITDGLCASEEDQASFDSEEKGHPPQDDES